MDESRIQGIIDQIDPPLGTVRVLSHYGGAGLFFCWLGFHDRWHIDMDGDPVGRIEHVCMRCGKSLSIIESEWEGMDG